MIKLSRAFIDSANHDAAVRAHNMGLGTRSFLARAWRMESSTNGGASVGLRYMKKDRNMGFHIS